MDLEPFHLTITLGGGWKMTVTKRMLVSETIMDVWCGVAKTDKKAVGVYGLQSDGEGWSELPEDVELAQVVFEPTYEKIGSSWAVKSPGRTWLIECPESGMDKPAELDLLSMIPLQDVMANIFRLGMLLPTDVGPVSIQ